MVCVVQSTLYKYGCIKNQFDASDYPPLGRYPWALHSVKDFWGCRWHRMMTVSRLIQLCNLLPSALMHATT